MRMKKQGGSLASFASFPIGGSTGAPALPDVSFQLVTTATNMGPLTNTVSNQLVVT